MQPRPDLQKILWQIYDHKYDNFQNILYDDVMILSYDKAMIKLWSQICDHNFVITLDCDCFSKT